MKFIVNKKTEIVESKDSEPYFYADLLIICLNTRDPRTRGYSREDVKIRKKLKRSLELVCDKQVEISKSNQSQLIELEDADYKYIDQILNTFTFADLSDDTENFIADFESAVSDKTKVVFPVKQEMEIVEKTATIEDNIAAKE